MPQEHDVRVRHSVPHFNSPLVGVDLEREVIEKIEIFILKRAELGFRTSSEVIREALRRFLYSSDDIPKVIV